MLGEEEAISMIDENDQVEVACDFCGQEYVLTDTQVRGLFDPKTANNPIVKLH